MIPFLGLFLTSTIYNMSGAEGLTSLLLLGRQSQKNFLKMSFEREVGAELCRVQGLALTSLEGTRKVLGSSDSALLLLQILSLIFNLVNHTLLVA